MEGAAFQEYLKRRFFEFLIFISICSGMEEAKAPLASVDLPYKILLLGLKMAKKQESV